MSEKKSLLLGHKVVDVPLYIAVKENQYSICELLIKAGANVNLMNTLGVTPLYRAIVLDNNQMLELLINNGANLEQKVGGDTALHSYIRINHGNIEGVKLLISKGADLSARDSDGDSPLHSAIWHNQGKVVELLIAAGANVNARNDNGLRPINIRSSLNLNQLLSGGLNKYEVKAGENLYAIAKKYNTTVKAIRTINRLESANLSPGQKLIIP